MQVYSSTDAGAPVLTNTNGSFVSLLSAVLVTGYGSKTAAGWTKAAYSTATIGVFQQGAGGNGRYFRVYDTSAVNTPRIARIRGYETMTAVSTGTGPFPTTAQLAGNGAVFVYKRFDTYTPPDPEPPVQVAPPWMIMADSKSVWVFIDTFGDPSSTSYVTTTFFGHFDSYKAGDTFNEIVMGSQADSNESWSGSFNDIGGGWVTRGQTGVSGAVWAGPVPSSWASGSTVGNGSYQYPDPVTNGLLMSKINLVTTVSTGASSPGLNTTSVSRGVLPWAYDHPHPYSVFPRDSTFTGSGAFAGKTFMIKRIYGNATMIVETSDTWS